MSEINDLETIRVPDVVTINRLYLQYLAPRGVKLVVKTWRNVDRDAEYQSKTAVYYYRPDVSEDSMTRVFATVALVADGRLNVDDVSRVAPVAVPADMRAFVNRGEYYSVVPVWLMRDKTWPWHLYTALTSIQVLGAVSEDTLRMAMSASAGVKQAASISAHKVELCAGDRGATVYIYPPQDVSYSVFVNKYVYGEGRREFFAVGDRSFEPAVCTSVMALPELDVLKMFVMRNSQILYVRTV